MVKIATNYQNETLLKLCGKSHYLSDNQIIIENIIKDFEKLYLTCEIDNNNHDIGLKTIDGKIFYCNKAILGRFDFFKNMFNSGLSESNSKEILIENLGSKGLETILRYIYTDKLEINLDVCVEVYVASKIFEMQEIYEFAESVNDALIKGRCKNFGKKNLREIISNYSAQNSIPFSLTPNDLN